jgi:hypothetical protein
MYKMLSFLSLISLVCLMFRNEERVVFIAIMLSCILLDFQSINLFSLKTFLLKIFSTIIDMVVLHVKFNQSNLSLKTLRDFFN